MKLAARFTIALIACSLRGVAGEAPWPAHTIAENFANWAQTIPGDLKEATVFTHPSVRLESTVRATGKVRPISPRTAAFLKGYLDTKFVPPAFLALYTSEVEVVEGSRVAWVALQDSLVPPYRDELGKGGQARIHGIVAGLNRGEIVVLVVGFETLSGNEKRR